MSNHDYNTQDFKHVMEYVDSLDTIGDSLYDFPCETVNSRQAKDWSME